MALALGIGHPFWAAVIVAALMPTLAAADVWRRAIHLMAEPGHLVLIVVIISARQPQRSRYRETSAWPCCSSARWPSA